MTCEKCGGKLEVVDTRHPEPQVVWRRRKCSDCQDILHTFEIPRKEMEELRRMERNQRLAARASNAAHAPTPLNKAPLTGGQT